MRLRHVVLFFAAFLVLFLLFAELAGKARGPIAVQAAATSGQEMYNAYCAECHGLSGKGGRASATTFGTPAADLTILAKRNNGRFPMGVVRDAIRGEGHQTVYREGQMPPWGHLFRYLGSGSQLEVDVRINRLADFLQSLQEK